MFNKKGTNVKYKGKNSLKRVLMYISIEQIPLLRLFMNYIKYMRQIPITKLKMIIV